MTRSNENAGTPAATPTPPEKKKPAVERWVSPFASYSFPYEFPPKSGKTKLARFVANGLNLNLEDTESKVISETLRKNTRLGVDFYLMEDVEAAASVDKKANTLEKLMNMSEAELLRLFEPDELKKLGLPGNCQDRTKLIAGFLMLKNLV